MGVTYKGLDCLADSGTSMFLEYEVQSQATIPWAHLTYYGKATAYFGAASIFAVLVKNFYYILKDRRRIRGRPLLLSPLTFFSQLVDVGSAYCRFLGYRQTPTWLVLYFSCPLSIGNLLYAMITSGYLLCYCFVPHFWYRGCSGFGSPPLAIRAGIMAAALLPFLLSLSGKANVISILTGIGYEKLNWLHQFLGVSMLVLATVHVVPFIYQAAAEGGASNLSVAFTDSMYQSGIVPYVCLFLLCTMFKREIRQKVYELSLHMHWMLGCAFLGTLTWHVYGMLNMEDYMWALLAVWGAQWIYRVLTNSVARTRPAELRRLSHGMFEITIHDVRGRKWQPGQHFFLRFPGVRILDNHPFSVASVVADEHMKFIVMSKNGLTRKLMAELNDQVAIRKVIVDGPYGGCARDALAFDLVFLFASGNGITATLPFLSQLAQEANGPSVNLVWIVKHLDDMLWIHDDIERALHNNNPRVKVSVHVVHDSFVLQKKSSIQVHYGKPNVAAIVYSLGKVLSTRNLFVSSGSASMRRTVSDGVARLQTYVINDCVSVEEVCLHTETFGW